MVVVEGEAEEEENEEEENGEEDKWTKESEGRVCPTLINSPTLTRDA